MGLYLLKVGWWKETKYEMGCGIFLFVMGLRQTGRLAVKSLEVWAKLGAVDPFKFYFLVGKMSCSHLNGVASRNASATPWGQ